MKSLKMVLLFVASLGLLAYGCAKSDDSSGGGSTANTNKYTRSNTPAKSSVSVPASLSAGNSGQRSANAGSSNGIFYSELKNGVGQMKMSVSNADLNLIMIDARYDDTEMGTCYNQGAWTLTFSQEMYNALVAMEEDFGGEEGESNSMSSQFKQYIGQTMTPPISYKLVDNLSTGGYKYELKVGDGCSGNTVTGSYIDTLRWDDNKTKLQTAFKSEGVDGSFSYDDAKKKSTVNINFSMGSDNFTSLMNLAECSTSQKEGMSGDCAVFGFTQKYSYTHNSSKETAMIKAKGKADDSGGYGEASMSFNSSSFGNMKMQYKEKWNSAGSLTYVAFKDNGSSTWQTMSGTAPGSDDAYAESDYDAQGYNVSVKVGSDNFSSSGSYHITLEDQSSKPEAIVGYGEIRGSETFWDYWGADNSSTHYLYGADNNSQISGVTITITPK